MSQNRKTWTVRMSQGEKVGAYLVTRDYRQIDQAMFSSLGLNTFLMPKQTAENWAEVLNKTRTEDDIRRGINFQAVRPEITA